jgi:catechol 2,3-dioxygenase-like lactoylglutathione lyase family enzyme
MQSAMTLLVVDNLIKATEFYTQVLELTLIEQHDDCVKLQAGDHLVIAFEGTKKAVDYQHGYAANSNLLLVVDDLDDKIAQLSSHGVEFIHETPNQNRWVKYAAFRDPAGIVHELCQLI